MTNMKHTIFFVLLAMAAVHFAQTRAQAASATVEKASAVQLFVQDRDVVFPEEEQARLRQQIVSLVRSSNFHSGSGDEHRVFTSAGVQQDYRDTVATGEFLLMTLSSAQKIVTVGGEVTAVEIVVGLRGPSGKSSVFTIDESGTIVAHAKYSGDIYLDLKRTVERSRSTVNDDMR